MIYKINIDKYGFAEKPNPEGVKNSYEIKYTDNKIEEVNEKINSEIEKLDTKINSGIDAITDAVANLENTISDELSSVQAKIPSQLSDLENNMNYAVSSTTLSGYGITDAYTCAEIDGQIGDIETALDSIIAIQNTLIGGGTT